MRCIVPQFPSRNNPPQHVRRKAKVVQSREPNWKGKLSRWRKKALKKKDRDRKRKGKRRNERPHGGAARGSNKGVAICGMMKAAKPNHQGQRKDAMRKYITQHVPGTFITFEQRQTLAADWNGLVRAGRRVTLRQFAAKHGLRHETWRWEYNRGATGEAVPDARDRRRRKYAEYDPFKAQDAINANNANKGARMLVTNRMVLLFKRHVLEERLSPYDAICRMKETTNMRMFELLPRPLGSIFRNLSHLTCNLRAYQICLDSLEPPLRSHLRHHRDWA